jgi:hypothetical protein
METMQYKGQPHGLAMLAKRYGRVGYTQTTWMEPQDAALAYGAANVRITSDALYVYDFPRLWIELEE